MFARAKRFNYPTEEHQDITPKCSRYTKRHPSQMSASPPTGAIPKVKMTPKLTPKNDMMHMLSQLKKLEIRMQERCQTMESLCRDYFKDEGFSSTRSSTPQLEEDLALEPAFEDSLLPQEMVDLYVEKIADIVCKKMLESRRKNCFWRKVKDFFYPKIVDGIIAE